MGTHIKHTRANHVVTFLGLATQHSGQRFLTAARRAGECVWRLGLLHKGPGLCHGISGNAYSLLALYRDDPAAQRGGSAVWLARAGAFAAFMESSILSGQGRG